MPALLAVGGHLKNTIAGSVGREIFVSQHIGDLETAQAFDAFRRVIASFQELYELRPMAVACDLHPDYLSTHFARQNGPRVVPVQHHYAHVLSCMAENELAGPLLGVAWDGTGYGLDGTIWGGEFLLLTAASFTRAAHFRPFPLPGGEKAIREPRRAALGLLYEMLGEKLFAMGELAPVQAFSREELRILRTMLQRGVNAPLAASAGRLFDAIAAIVGLRQEAGFEGQAAMELEFALDGIETDRQYRFEIVEGRRHDRSSSAIVDWEPMAREILKDARRRVPVAEISAKFHNTLAAIIVAVARRLSQERVVLSGGCFQNRYLTERAVSRLRREGFRPYWHQRIPPNDGGIALGQIRGAALEQVEEQSSCA
jgi:hydrogenase maturation protein HypF